MQRLLLFAVLAVGCAHAPNAPVPVLSVEQPGSGGPGEIRIIREAVRAELLAASRPGYNDLFAALQGQPTYLGTIDFTGTSKTNGQATIPFNNTGETLCGKLLLLQPTQGVYIGKSGTSGGTVTAVNGVELDPKERVVWLMPQGVNCYIAALRVTADGNLKVWWLQ